MPRPNIEGPMCLATIGPVVRGDVDATANIAGRSTEGEMVLCHGLTDGVVGLTLCVPRYRSTGAWVEAEMVTGMCCSMCCVKCNHDAF